MAEYLDLNIKSPYSKSELKRMEVWGGVASPDLKKVEIRKHLAGLPQENGKVNWDKLHGLFALVGDLDFEPFIDTDGLPVDGGSDHTPNTWTISSETFRKAATAAEARAAGGRLSDKDRDQLSKASITMRKAVQALDASDEFKKETGRVFIEIIKES